MPRRAIWLLLFSAVLLSSAAEAQQPLPPTIQAVRLTTPLRIDGKLDETVYATVPPMSGFTQQEPTEGAPATERTEVWFFYDRDNVYIVARCWESEPGRIIANELRRDHNTVGAGNNDTFAFTLDTFHDLRNSLIFHVSRIGGRVDGQGTNERQWSPDWNPVWGFAVETVEGGWIVETAIPFKSLRYRQGREQTWGFNARRVNKWKNEVSYLAPIPAARGMGAIMQVSLSAPVTLEAPERSKSLDVKPFATADLTSDLNAMPRLSNDVRGDFGFDLKYGVTQNLTADFTYNTDFAQVEADEQQINLTRFNLFFPEKREFFLENQGLFAFGGAANSGSGDTPILFYSRRIGLNQGRAVPLDAGGRLTGRIGRVNVGVLNIQADEERLSATPTTNFSVVRVTRDLLSGSSVGLIVTNRSVGQTGGGANQTFGLDGRFRFFNSLDFNTYWARTQTEGLSGENTSYRAQLDYTGDRYGAQLEHLTIGDNFNPEVGFLRRDDMRKNAVNVRFSPRSRSIRAVRRFVSTAGLNYLENGAGRVEYRDASSEFGIEFQSSDRFSIVGSHGQEFIPRRFAIGPRVNVRAGAYDFDNGQVTYSLGQQRRLSGTLLLEHGTLYGGHRTAVGINRGRVNVTPRFSLEPSYTINWVDVVEGSFTTHLLGSRVTYTVTPMMFVSALLQYNSASNAVTSNARFRWEYRPGSELFVVYNEQRDTLARHFPSLANRALIIKINRLFRF